MEETLGAAIKKLETTGGINREQRTKRPSDSLSRCVQVQLSNDESPSTIFHHQASSSHLTAASSRCVKHTRGRRRNKQRAGQKQLGRVKVCQVNDVFLNPNAAALNGRAAPNRRLPSGPAAGLASANQMRKILINSARGVKHAAEMKDACFPFFPPSSLFPDCYFLLAAAERDSDSKVSIPPQQQFHTRNICIERGRRETRAEELLSL